MRFNLDTKIVEELQEIQQHHTKIHAQIDKLGRKLFNDRTEKYRNTPQVNSWPALLKMLIDEYWNNSERLVEQELIDQFHQSD